MRFLTCFSLLFVAAVTLPTASCHGAGPDPETIEPVFRDPPRLATTPTELAVDRDAADFDRRVAGLVRKADALVANPVPLPEGYGSWYFYYACPDDGTRLKPDSLTEHTCPKCGETYTDDRTVAAYRCLQHHAIEHAALDLGWAYAHTKDDRYADQVKRILVHLADAYDSYPDRLDRWGNRGMLAPLGGRRYVQTLDEAVGAVRLTKAYDLTRSSEVWSDPQRRHVEEAFFRATADSMLRFRQKHNHQTWYNAGLISIASVLGDAELVRKVLTMREGVYDQLETMIGEDGLWFEGTMAYHSYALQAMLAIADAARRMDVPVHHHPRFRGMITGPLRAAYPNGQYPAINDSDRGNVRMFNYAFEWAWQVYGEDTFAHALAGGDVAKLHALLGDDAEPRPAVTASEVLTDAGLAILRGTSTDGPTAVFIDFGPHGGGHGHYDKLNIALYANGREWLLDPGRLTYSHKEYKTWVKETAAHNTVAIDGRSQRPTTGRLTRFDIDDDRGVTVAVVESDDAYPGARLRRSLMLAPNLLVDVYRVEVDADSKPRQLDWFAHAAADRVEPAAGQWGAAPVDPQPATLGNAKGYQHLTETKRWSLPRAASDDSTALTAWDFVAGDRRLRAWTGVHSPAEAETFTTHGIGYHVDEKAPTLLQRVSSGEDVTFVAVYDLAVDGAYVRSVTIERGEDVRLKIVTDDGVMHLGLSPFELPVSSGAER